MNDGRMTAAEAAVILGTTRKQVSAWCTAGRIPAVLEKRYPNRTAQFYILRSDVEVMAFELSRQRQPPDDYVTISQAMEITGLSINALRYRCQEGIYTVRKAAHDRWLILRADVLRDAGTEQPRRIMTVRTPARLEDVRGDLEPEHGSPVDEMEYMQWHRVHHMRHVPRMVRRMPFAVVMMRVDHRGQVWADYTTRCYGVYQMWCDADHW